MPAARTPWPYRFTLYLLLFGLQTKNRIRAIIDWPGFAGWSDQISNLRTDDTFINLFDPEDRKAIKDNAALVTEQFHVWQARVPISEWIHWPIYMAVCPILLSVALWIIDEPVFALRGHAYYCIFLLQLLKCSLSPYATAGVFKRLHRDFGATTPFPAILFLIVAFGAGCRYLYRETWYLAINILATTGLIYRVQYHAVVKGLWRDWRRDHSIVRNGWRFRFPETNGPGIGQDDTIVPILTTLTAGLQHYKTNFSHFRGDYVHNVQDTAVKEGVENIIRTLLRALSQQARTHHQSNSGDLSTRRIKAWFTGGFFVAGLATIITLFHQPGSLVQAVISVLAGGCMMIIWTFLQRYSVDAFTDYYVPKMAGLFWALFHVNCLLLKDQQWFSTNRVLFWGTYGALFFETFFLSDILVYYAKRYLKKKFEAPEAREVQN